MERTIKTRKWSETENERKTNEGEAEDRKREDGEEEGAEPPVLFCVNFIRRISTVNSREEEEGARREEVRNGGGEGRDDLSAWERGGNKKFESLWHEDAILTSI